MHRKYDVSTPDLLIDASERLFGQKGYAAVPLSVIAREANAKVGQIVYHFGTKESLFQACIVRRAEPLSVERRELLDNYVRLVGSDQVKIEPLIRAFINPFFDKVTGSDEGWHNYALLLARIVWRENSTPVISEAFDRTARLFLDHFQKALPGLTEAGAVRGFQFMLGALYSAVSDDKRVEILTEGRLSAVDYSENYKLLVPFISSGFERIAEEEEKN